MNIRRKEEALAGLIPATAPLPGGLSDFDAVFAMSTLQRIRRGPDRPPGVVKTVDMEPGETRRLSSWELQASFATAGRPNRPNCSIIIPMASQVKRRKHNFL